MDKCPYCLAPIEEGNDKVECVACNECVCDACCQTDNIELYCLDCWERIEQVT